ncbi:MAG: magnesium transporter [Planctomycetaceae bacterium]|nr:magnesium transporter [Planctomycetaceae bacterium]
MPVNPIYLPELREMLAENNVEEMREFCAAIHPVRAAEFMDGLEPLQIWTIISQTDLQTRVEIFKYLDEEVQADIMESAPREEIAEFISHLPSDDRVDTLQAVEEDVVDELMPLINAEDRRDIQRLTAFPEGSCGSEMTTDYIRLRENMTVSEALNEIAKFSEVTETVYYLYVVDEFDHLTGLVSAKQLLKNVGRPNLLISSLMKRDLVTVDAYESREEAARQVVRYDFLAIPVVDESHRLLGIITFDDIMDVVQDEATEDAYLQAAISPMEEPYLEVPFWTMWKNRFFWLACLFITQLATFSAMAHYEDSMKALTVLALFVPLVLSTGGNSGSQASTLITRALALDEVRISDVLRIVKHELLMGLVLGFGLGIIGFLRAYLTPESMIGEADRILLSITICMTVAAICLCGTMIGALLPLAFKKAGVDPGIASGPFVATVVDVCGIVIFFSFVTAWLL